MDGNDGIVSSLLYHTLHSSGEEPNVTGCDDVNISLVLEAQNKVR